LAVSLSVITAFAGVYLYCYLDRAPAPTIVVLFAIVFIAAFIYSTWRDRRNEIVPEAQG
ncbi:metal ABC transporter permease, partial [Salmonella enterica]|uniref:metal ABC transporter permease n=1 Tax=Salmonella enterica TaxID=28901 RepID=UPI0034DB00AF|nr:metal ABC transporter permease [Salmonella enterica subsp. enterica serovar Weltevreden]